VSSSLPCEVDVFFVVSIIGVIALPSEANLTQSTAIPGNAVAPPASREKNMCVHFIGCARSN
jgi:hypothetical protein